MWYMQIMDERTLELFMKDKTKDFIFKIMKEDNIFYTILYWKE